MKTKKQVMEQFYRLQKRYSEIPNTIITLRVYHNYERSWTVGLSVSKFAGTDLLWTECLEWEHWTCHDEQDEAANEKKVRRFVEMMEGR